MRSLLVSSALIFTSFFCFAQAKWNCGVDGAVNVVAYFDGATQALTISGKGKMNDYSRHGKPWDSVKDAIKIVKINQGVTTIGSHAFNDLSNLEAVTVANGVTDIGDGAFDQDKNLRKITIPNSVTIIRNSAFRGTGLESISLSSSVKEMWNAVFSGCSSLKTADLSNTQLTRLDDFAFADSEQLENVYLPSKITNIGMAVFSGCKSLKSITCYNSTPPQDSSGPRPVFGTEGDDYIDISQLTLYVPEASIVIYKYSDLWKKFGKIEAIPTSSTK